MERFYVYVYLDPRKPGNFIYENLVFDYEPFYVGKGTGLRLYNHLYESSVSRNKIKYNKIKKIKNVGLEPIIIKISDNIEESTALKLECETIKKIGRKDLFVGPLLNLTDGGEKGGGGIMKEESKKKLSESLKSSEVFQKAVRKKEKIEKTVASLKKFYENNESKKKGVLRTEEEIEKIKETMSIVYKIQTPSNDIIEIRGTSEVLEYFKNLNIQLGLKSRFRISPYAIIYGEGSKGYFLVEKLNDYRNMSWNEDKKIKNSIRNTKTENKNSCEYIILCPEGHTITLLGRENLKKFINEINSTKGLNISFYGIVDRGESKGYKLVERRKIYKK